MNRHKNILIARTDRVGDVVLTIPLIKKIKDSFPDAKIYFLANLYTKDILEKNENLEAVLIVEDSFAANYRNIKKYDIDTVISVNPSFKLALLFFFLRISTRVGTAYRWYSFLFNHKQHEHRRYGNKHEAEFNINLLKALGISNNGEYDFGIKVTSDDDNTVNRLLVEKGLREKCALIIVHPGSGGSAMDLPISSLKKLVQKLADLKAVKICFTGIRTEWELIKELNCAINNTGITFVDELNLRELSVLIKKSDLFISNSTGPIHIAAAVGTHVIGFYPPVRPMSEKRWGPFTGNKTVFVPSLRNEKVIDESNYCKKCLKTGCEHYSCMNQIDVGMVYQKIIEHISKKRL